MTDLLGKERGATFSKDRRFRYRLWEIWDRSKPLMNMLMLNPSKADEVRSDPTVTRCVVRAQKYGAGGLIVTNAYAFVSTDPKELKRARFPIGPDNDDHIVEVARAVRESRGHVICGWGAHIELTRARDILRLLRHQANAVPKALVYTKGGQPGHPLYVTYDIGPMEIINPNFCHGCGCEIAPSSDGLCGECACEDDSAIW